MCACLRYNTWLWPRGVAVNMSPCHGEDRRFESDRGRQVVVVLLLLSLLTCFLLWMRYTSKIFRLTRAEVHDRLRSAKHGSKTKTIALRTGDILFRRRAKPDAILMYKVAGLFFTHSAMYCGDGKIVEAAGWRAVRSKEIRVLTAAIKEWADGAETTLILRNTQKSHTKMCKNLLHIAADNNHKYGFNPAKRMYSCVSLIYSQLNPHMRPIFRNNFMTPDYLFEYLLKNGYKIVGRQ